MEDRRPTARSEGSAMPYDFTLTVSGDTLTFTDSGGARDFCVASRRPG